MRPHVISVPYRYDQADEGLGLGPQTLLDMGLRDQASAVSVAHLADEDREEDRTAVNIGKLGRSTANLVARARSNGEPVLVLAGDDTAIVGVVAGLQKSDGASRALGIIWFDAHGDFNTPDTSYSGILAGMPLAVIAGLAGPRWRDAADLGVPVQGDRMLLVGVRDTDKAEESLLEANSVARVSVADVRAGTTFNEALQRLAAKSEYLLINIDIDVLDQHLVPSSTTPSEGGLEIEELNALIEQILATNLVAAVSITSLNPLGGSRGQTATRSAWSVVANTVARWEQIPASRSVY